MNKSIQHLWLPALIVLMTGCSEWRLLTWAFADEPVTPLVVSQGQSMMSLGGVRDFQESSASFNTLSTADPKQESSQTLPQTLPEFSEVLVHSAVTGGVRGAQNRLSNVGMPKNTRQCPEGYWIGARPIRQQIDELYAHDIRLVISASSMPQSTYNDISSRMAEFGMTHLNIPFGGRFPNPNRFMDTVHQFAPHQIFIHCEHGGDRSGAILAYLLIVDQGWSVSQALLAVAFPGKHDAPAMVELLRKKGFVVSDQEVSDFLGIYSGESNGGYGGLKVRSDGYVKLINTTIDAATRYIRNHPKSNGE